LIIKALLSTSAKEAIQSTPRPEEGIVYFNLPRGQGKASDVSKEKQTQEMGGLLFLRIELDVRDYLSRRIIE